MKHGPGTFLVTFPKAYHAGFSYGFNVGEAVNFATYDWLSSGGEAEERYRTFARNSVFSHQRLLFTLLHHKADVATQYQAKYVTHHSTISHSLSLFDHTLSIIPYFFFFVASHHAIYSYSLSLHEVSSLAFCILINMPFIKSFPSNFSILLSSLSPSIPLSLYLSSYPSFLVYNDCLTPLDWPLKC